VPSIPSNAELVVVYGSRNDVSVAGDIESAANDLFAAIAEQAPDAKLLVVGPTWQTDDVPDGVLAIDDGLAGASAAHGAAFASSSTKSILIATDGLVGEDGTHPTDEGHVAIAAFMAPLVEQAMMDE